MKTTFLDFEQPIAELEGKIEELRFVQDDSAVDISEEISRLESKSQSLTKDLYGKLTPWQIAQVARHPQRPYTLDYARLIFTDFVELSIRARLKDRALDAAVLRRMTATARDAFGCYVWMHFWQLFARMPFLRLDRIYVRNVAGVRPLPMPRHPWSRLSDHAPLAAEVQLAKEAA